MRNIRIHSVAALLFALAAAACAPRATVPTPTREITTAPIPSATGPPVRPAIGTSYPAAVILPSIRRLSPSSFTVDGVTFEAIAYTRMSCLKFTVQITSDNPIPSPAQDPSFEPVIGLEFYSGAGAPLVLTPEGRGGGGGTGGPRGAWYQLSRDFLYDVRSPLPISDIVALVTFHRSLGISGPARFDIQPVVRPNLYCPQLPPTTPEG